MQTANDMSKDLSFRLRLDAADRARLEAVATHYSATASTAVRILIKEKYDAIMAAAPPAVDREDFRDEHGLLLEILCEAHQDSGGKPIPRHDLDDIGRDIDLLLPSYPTANFHGGLARVLNELVRWGYLRRIKGPALVVLPKAIDWNG